MLAATSHFEESRRAAIERFQRVLQDPRQAEERFVAEVLRANAATVFGREHGFDRVRTLEDFRSAVPIRDYDALESWLDQAPFEQRLLDKVDAWAQHRGLPESGSEERASARVGIEVPGGRYSMSPWPSRDSAPL